MALSGSSGAGAGSASGGGTAGGSLGGRLGSFRLAEPGELYTVIINGARDDAGTEDGYWTRVVVPVPTLLVSYIDTTISPTGDIGSIYLSAQYGTRDQFQQDRVRREMAAIQGGVIWLHYPGTWWIRCVYTEANSAASPQNGSITLPFVAYPNPSDAQVDAHLFARRAQQVTRAQKQLSSVSNPETIVSAQTLLNGTVAVRIAVRAQHARLYWGSATGSYEQMRTNSKIVFEGPTLPLTSMFVKGDAGSNSTILAEIFRR